MPDSSVWPPPLFVEESLGGAACGLGMTRKGREGGEHRWTETLGGSGVREKGACEEETRTNYFLEE